MQALPANAENGVGCNEEWWAGFSCARAKRVYCNNLMMSEAHVFAFANLMKRPICVVDTRLSAAVIRIYRPGYSVKGLDISLYTAQHLHMVEPQCIWVRLHGAHFTALVRQVDLRQTV